VIDGLLNRPTVRGGGDAVTVDSEPKRPLVKSQRELEGVPFGRQARVDPQPIAVRSDAGEPECECLPKPAHRGQVQSAGGAAGQVVEIQPGRDPQRLLRWSVAAGASEQAGG
jgi:hypothetical protein